MFSHISVLLPQENSRVTVPDPGESFFPLPEQPFGISPHFEEEFPSWTNDSYRQPSLLYRVPLNRPYAVSMSWLLKAILQLMWRCRYFFEIMTSFTFNQYPEVEFLGPGGYFLIIWWKAADAVSSVWAEASLTGFRGCVRGWQFSLARDVMAAGVLPPPPPTPCLLPL